MSYEKGIVMTCIIVLKIKSFFSNRRDYYILSLYTGKDAFGRSPVQRDNNL